MNRQQIEARRLDPQAGIAIGPILFIVAILGILAAAIAAGSGSFTANTSTESARTKAAALIQIGENLKIGMDRITMQGGIDPENVDINTLNTQNSDELFSPTGGGIAVPSTSMANTAGTDTWYFVKGPIAGFGLNASNEVFAVLRVANSVCAEINNRTMGSATTPTGAELGNFASNATTLAQTITNWPTTPALRGITVGCVNNTNAGSTGTYFYQVMGIQ